MDKKSKLPFIFIILLTIAVVVFLFIKTVLWQNFSIINVDENSQQAEIL
jgi:hypothetical protein